MKNKSFLLLIGALLIFLGVGYLLEKLNIVLKIVETILLKDATLCGFIILTH